MVKNNFDSKLLTRLLARNMFFNFAVQYLAKHPEVKEDFAVTPETRAEFFRFVEASHFDTAEDLQKQWTDDPHHDLVDLALRTEMINAKFGLEAGWRVRASGDTQVQKALTMFDEAARIAALPKKSPGARASKNERAEK